MGKNNKRQYGNDYPSVTSVLSGLRNLALEGWLKYNSAVFCNAESEKGKLIGTQIHSAIQLYIQKEEVKIETEYEAEVTTLLKSFILFRKEHPEFILTASEMPMTSEVYKFNGTMDCVGSLHGELIVFDWKSGKCKDDSSPPIYDEYLYQTSAYCKLYEEIQGTEIKTAYVLAIAKDKEAYSLQKISKEEINHYFNEIFLPALKICYGKRKFKKKNDFSFWEK